MKRTPETRLSLIGRLADPRGHQAWIEFVDIYQPLIESVAMRKGLQHADAIEVTEEELHCVADAIEDWDPDRSKGTFRGWLFRTTRNLTIWIAKEGSGEAQDAECSFFAKRNRAGSYPCHFMRVCNLRDFHVAG